MSKFVVNKNYSNSKRTIEAESYEIKDGYFHFYDAVGQVASLAQGGVHTVDRDDERA